MSSWRVWDFWKKIKYYRSTIFNAILAVFTFLSILSITHPQLLPLTILWFLNDVYYHYLIQASILLGTNLAWLISTIPNFPSHVPSEENKEFFYFTIIHTLPGLSELSYSYRRLDVLLPRLIVKTIRGSIPNYLYRLTRRWFKGR